MPPLPKLSTLKPLFHILTFTLLNFPNPLPYLSDPSTLRSSARFTETERRRASVSTPTRVGALREQSARKRVPQPRDLTLIPKKN